MGEVAFTIEFRNVALIVKALRKVGGDRNVRNTTRRALKAGGAVFRNNARRKLTSNRKHTKLNKTQRREGRGRTRKSIIVKESRIINNIVKVTAAATGNLSHLIEFGTVMRFRKYKIKRGKKGFFVVKPEFGGGSGYTGAMPALPFMRPAYEESKIKVKAAILKKMVGGVHRAVRANRVKGK